MLSAFYSSVSSELMDSMSSQSFRLRNTGFNLLLLGKKYVNLHKIIHLTSVLTLSFVFNVAFCSLLLKLSVERIFTGRICSILFAYTCSYDII